MFVVSSVRAKGSSLALVGYTSSDGDALWGKCFTSTSVAPHLFLLGWCLSFFWLWQTWPVTWGYWNTCFLVALCLLIVRRPNLEVAIKRLLHQVYKNTRVVFVPCESLQLFLRYPSVICYNRQVLNEGHKNYFKDWCLMNSQPTFLFFSEFKLIELWPYYQKHVNQIITSDASICSTMAFPPIGKFWSCCLNFHWLSIKLSTGCPIHHISYHYSRADWNGLCDHLRDVP